MGHVGCRSAEGGMRRYDFAERLGWSEGHAPTIEHVSRILVDRIPGCTHITGASNADNRRGTDFLAHRRGLSPLRIDLKLRDSDCTDYGKDDLALETWSKIEKTEPHPYSPFVSGTSVGWTRDASKNTDLILWHWRSTGRFCLVPFPPLCNAFSRLWRDWAARFPCASQDSGAWYSQCVYTPRGVVLHTLLRWMNSGQEVQTQ